MGFTPLPAADLRAYVALARHKNPHVPRELTEYVAAAYAELRQEEASPSRGPRHWFLRSLAPGSLVAQALPVCADLTMEAAGRWL